jgi:hypothetical protein
VVYILNIRKYLQNSKYIRNSWLTLVVCCTLIIVVCGLCFGLRILKDSAQEIIASTNSVELGLITIYDIRSARGPSGGAFVKKTWQNANPWTEEEKLDVLPVFRNTWEPAENNTDDDYEAMESVLIDAATYFGVEHNQFEIKNMFSQIFAEMDNLQIYVGDDMTTRIYFEQGVPLPAKYNISQEASYEEKQKAAKYLRNTYKKLTNMKNLQINVTDGGNNISLFEGGGDLADRIVNYNFNKSVFCFDNDGLLTSIIIYRPDLSQKVGDYPIISVVEAKELLEKGHFYGGGSSMTRNEEGKLVHVFPGLEYVKHVEMVYMIETSHNVYIPYYAFYAGAWYYVPAVEPQYITNMPIDGMYSELD